MVLKTETFEYDFSDLVMTAHRIAGRQKTVWYLKCPECQQEHLFRKLGRKIWVAICNRYQVEYTVTPREYYRAKECDFTKIMGHTDDV
jgi:hypothetical protein